MALSFHIKKQLPISKGGMILTNDFEGTGKSGLRRLGMKVGKNYKDDDIDFLGWNMYMTPQHCSWTIPNEVPDIKEDLEEKNGYRDLTEFTLFKKIRQLNKLF